MDELDQQLKEERLQEMADDARADAYVEAISLYNLEKGDKTDFPDFQTWVEAQQNVDEY